MKAKAAAVLLLAVGAGLWIALAHTAKFSVKKWDAKFSSVLRHSLHENGLTDKNLKSSVHEIQTDDAGRWILHRMTVEGIDSDKLQRVRAALIKSGAEVRERKMDGGRLLVVRRGNRIYQEVLVRP